MSRAFLMPLALVAPAVVALFKMGQFKLAKNVDLPAGLVPDSFPNMLSDRRFSEEASFLPEQLLPLMNDGFRVEDISAPIFDMGLPAETFIPLEYPVHPAKTGAWEEKGKEIPSPVALPDRKESALPTAGHKAVEVMLGEKHGEAESLAGLLAYLKAQGLKVKEVKSLSEGATRITLDDYLGRREAREPEFVRVR